jgi:archaellum biogenesis protein FlaJ (TadC family)
MRGISLLAEDPLASQVLCSMPLVGWLVSQTVICLIVLTICITLTVNTSNTGGKVTYHNYEAFIALLFSVPVFSGTTPFVMHTFLASELKTFRRLRHTFSR